MPRLPTTNGEIVWHASTATTSESTGLGTRASCWTDVSSWTDVGGLTPIPNDDAEVLDQLCRELADSSLQAPPCIDNGQSGETVRECPSSASILTNPDHA